MTQPETIQAPFTAEQVLALNKYQAGGAFHPFTCGNEAHEHHVSLRATTAGWICPDCDYTQDWAWAGMLTIASPFGEPAR